MKSKLKLWPARLDAAQSLTGLLLLLFICGHMFFESSILLGKDAMFWVSRMFEGEPIFGKPYPALVSAIVAIVFLLLVLHAWLAMRKFPADYRQYHAMHKHMNGMKHSDTTLWYVQVITGFAMFFLASVHLYGMFAQPELIGPYASADRIWSGRYWPLYLMLLVAVQLHAGVGFYRLAMKWGWFKADSSPRMRRRLKLAMWCMIVFYLALGGTTLFTYMQIGAEHAPHAGERYYPADYQPLEDH